MLELDLPFNLLFLGPAFNILFDGVDWEKNGWLVDKHTLPGYFLCIINSLLLLIFIFFFKEPRNLKMGLLNEEGEEKEFRLVFVV